MTLLIFFLLLISYIVILSSLKSHSSEGQRKALSTCGFHFTVVMFFFGPCIFTYTHPVATYSADKVVTVFYGILTPMLNLIINTVRNTEVKNAMKSLLKKRLTKAVHDAKIIIIYIIGMIICVASYGKQLRFFSIIGQNITPRN